MGDILHALPAVTALRQAHPDWEMGWVVEPRWQALLTTGNLAEGADSEPGSADQAFPARKLAQPVVDRVHFAPTKQWAKRPLSAHTLDELAALRRELRTCKYSAVIDFQGAIRSAILARMAGSSRVLGESEPRERAARWLYTERIPTNGAHVIEQDMELARSIAGDALHHAAPLLPVDFEAENWCNALLSASGDQPVVLIAPGAGWGAKRWPVERYATVAAGLNQRGMRVLINTGPGEEPLAAAIESASNHSATPVKASLSQLIALTRRIALCVAGDTGPLHLACALGRRVVGIYGPTDPSRNGPYGTRFVVLRSPLSRRDHSRRAEPESGLLTITPEDVLQATDSLLAEEKG